MRIDIKNLRKANQTAIERGGRCLSTQYIKASEKLLWKCSNPDHKEWHAIYSNVVHLGTWCPECGAINKAKNHKNGNGLKLAKEHAKKLGGECLSDEYLGNHHHLIWKCSNPNHKPWSARYSSVMNTGSWCPECAGRKGGNHD